MKRIFALAFLLAVALPASAQTRQINLFQSESANDGEGNKIVGIPYAYATLSSLTPGAAGTFCGSQAAAASTELYAMRFKPGNWGQSVAIVNPSSANAIIRPYNTNAGFCDYTSTCYPPGIPGDSDVIVGGGNIQNMCTSLNLWPGWYEMGVIFASATTIYTSSGTTTRNTTGQYFYNPPSNALGYVQIHVRDASGINQSKSVTFRHPYGAVNHSFVTVTVNGDLTIELPVGRTADLRPAGSTDWTAITFPSKPTINHYYITLNSSGNAISVNSNESNQAPGADTYDGPPGESSWWTNMLCEAFCPAQDTKDDWKELFEGLGSWGPFGFVSGVMNLWQTYYEVPSQTQYLVHRLQLMGADISLDFRNMYDIPQPGPIAYCTEGQEIWCTRGTYYGFVRAQVRQLLGWILYVVSLVALWKHFQPKIQM